MHVCTQQLDQQPFYPSHAMKCHIWPHTEFRVLNEPDVINRGRPVAHSLHQNAIAEAYGLKQGQTAGFSAPFPACLEKRDTLQPCNVSLTSCTGTHWHMLRTLSKPSIRVRTIRVRKETLLMNRRHTMMNGVELHRKLVHIKPRRILQHRTKVPNNK